MDKRENLKGRTVAITGGSGVICACFAHALAQQGMNIAVLSRSLDKVEAVAKEINDAGGRAIAATCDVTDKSSVINAKKVINNAFGKVDVLINGAGGNHPHGNTTMETFEPSAIHNTDPDTVGFFDLAPENMDFVFRLNFMGSFIPCQVFMEDMIGNKNACVVNISSMSAYHPLTKVSAYSAAKAAISNFTEWLAVHFAKEGIRVNALAPGFFETAQNAELLRNPDGTLTSRSHKVIAHTPMNRFGVPEDLVGTLLWLVNSEDSGFVTGVTVPVDGGFNACSCV